MTEINSYPYRYHGDYSLESGIDAIRKLASFSEPPTAILATNNTMTIGALKALKQLNLRIPEEISIAGFNGIDHLELMETRPTVADYDPYKIGKAAGKAILERIKDNSIDNREYIFSPSLIRGNAVASV